MARGRKTGGRRPGSQNKMTKAMKEMLSIAFDDIGGREALVDWARKNQTAFYKLWVKLLPHEIVDKPVEPPKPAVVIYVPEKDRLPPQTAPHTTTESTAQRQPPSKTRA